MNGRFKDAGSISESEDSFPVIDNPCSTFENFFTTP